MEILSLLVLILFAGGGLVAGIVGLLVATFHGSRRITYNFAAFAVVCLLLQKGCWMGAQDFAKGFGGDKEKAARMTLVTNLLLGAGLAWAAVAVVRGRRKPSN